VYTRRAIFQERFGRARASIKVAVGTDRELDKLVVLLLVKQLVEEPHDAEPVHVLAGLQQPHDDAEVLRHGLDVGAEIFDKSDRVGLLVRDRPNKLGNALETNRVRFYVAAEDHASRQGVVRLVLDGRLVDVENRASVELDGRGGDRILVRCGVNVGGAVNRDVVCTLFVAPLDPVVGSFGGAAGQNTDASEVDVIHRERLEAGLRGESGGHDVCVVRGAWCVVRVLVCVIYVCILQGSRL
jgi:hypothetical protein